MFDDLPFEMLADLCPAPRCVSPPVGDADHGRSIQQREHHRCEEDGIAVDVPCLFEQVPAKQEDQPDANNGVQHPFQPLVDRDQAPFRRVNEDQVGFKRRVEDRQNGKQNHVEDGRNNEFNRPRIEV